MKSIVSNYISLFSSALFMRLKSESYDIGLATIEEPYPMMPPEKRKKIVSIPTGSFRKRLNHTINRSSDYLLKEQSEEGWWMGELEANTTLTSEYIMFMHYMGRVNEEKQKKALITLLDTQQKDGGWNIYYGGPSDLSTTIEAYFAFKLAGISPDESYMQKAREFILSKGGITESRVFTKIFLALFGQYRWEGVPAMPVEMILLPNSFYINIYEFSSWSRSVIVPLLIIFANKPICKIPGTSGVDELYCEPEEKRNYSINKAKGELRWKNLFIYLDSLIKIIGKNSIKPLRSIAIKKAEKWILDHQDYTGDWGGIIPAMMNSIMALKSMGYHDDNPIIKKGLEAIDRFGIEKGDAFSLQSCISPAWDTSITCNALRDAGFPDDHPALVKSAGWLMNKQVLRKGDWAIKNPDTEPGGWAFEFANDFYPDNDTTAEVLRALTRTSLPGENEQKSLVIQRGLNWLLSMQGEDGGWGAFDVNNNKEILNKIPFADLESLLDPSTCDVTGHVLWLLGEMGYDRNYAPIKTAIRFIKKRQEEDGAWYGRWGVNYIYGTFLVLCGLKSVGEDMNQGYIQKAVNWLKTHQNPDGGWGESCHSYQDKSYRGIGVTTPSQTAWALMGLLAAEEVHSSFVRKGVNYLIETQNSDGTWDEDEYTGTGFPKYFYIRYHMYKNYFPLMVLGRYRILFNKEN